MTDSDKSKERKDWNAMIYLAGENNLGEECVFALKEMKRALPETKLKSGNTDARVKVVAQLDAGGLGGDEARYVLTPGDEDGFLEHDVIARRDTTETSYRGVLKDFISSSIYIDGLAKHHLLVLSGHGNGLISDFLSRDIETPDKLSIPKIAWVLREVKQDVAERFGQEDGDNFKIDVLGLDSCMMSMAEIGYELRHYVNFMVGAEGFEPNTGWPYERILSALLANPSMKPEELCYWIVERYVTYYKDFLPAGRSVDQSACDLSKCDELAAAIRGLADVLIEKINNPETMRQVVLAHWEAQSYKDDQYVDLYDFCDLLDRGPSESATSQATGSVVMRGLNVDPAIRTACSNVKKVLRSNGTNSADPNTRTHMVLQSCYSGPAVQYSNGLSVYFPWSNVIESYKDLEFANDTNWKTFLSKYIDVTRRGKRLCPSATRQDVVKGRLFFNPNVAGFDFLLTSNKDAPALSRVLSNKVGSMKNPAVDHVPCVCPAKYPKNSTSHDKPKDNSVKQTDTQENQAKPAIETGKKGVKSGTRQQGTKR